MARNRPGAAADRAFGPVRPVGPGTNLFVLVLPTKTWTQRYVQDGCGGLCDSLYISPPEVSGCAPVANGQVALSGTDMRHEGNVLPDSTTPWETDPQAT